MASEAVLGFACVHGWGLDSGFFMPLKQALQTRFPNSVWWLAERGYFDQEVVALSDSGLSVLASQPMVQAEQTVRWIGIGHSYGFLQLLRSIEQHSEQYGEQIQGLPANKNHWLAVVSLCGFTEFCAPAVGVPKQVVQTMRDQLERAPQALLKNFYRNAGWPNPLAAQLDSSAAQQLQLGALSDDLQDLQSAALQATWQKLCHQGLPSLALAASNDAIVPAPLARTQLANATQLLWHAQGTHCLGFTHAGWCAEQIARFVNDLF